MFEKEITFDRFIRGTLVVTGLVAGLLLLHYLSDLLLPFFIAWVVAYMLYPFVAFLQYRLHLRSRILCITLCLVLLFTLLLGISLLVIPGVIHEGARLSTLAVQLTQDFLGDTGVAQHIEQFIQQNLTSSTVVKLISQDQVQETIQSILWYIWQLMTQTLGLLKALFTLFIFFLYTFFLLLDYERIFINWHRAIPAAHRPFAQQLVGDVLLGMNNYFRGQTLIALIVGILFAIGFSIVGLPMAIGLGLFIGILNLVPYLQLLGFAPALLCVAMHSLDTGQSFWAVMGWTLLVFIVVQIIQDMILVPRIMSQAMGLKPAVILLSLSIWGSLLGFIGLIIALPLTTLCISYYKRYILKEEGEK